MMNMDANVFIPMTRQRYIIENNDDDRVINIFTLVVYSTLVFPQSPGYVNATVVNLIEQIDNQANPIPAIVAETIRSLNFCKKKRQRRLYRLCSTTLHLGLKPLLEKMRNIY